MVLHDRPRYRPPRHGRELAWDLRYTAAFRFVAAQGRLPKQLGGREERGLQRWLYAQRLKLESGELDERKVGLLEALGEWWD
ncbi:Helicase associated domain protein [Arthrobacter sp. KK5.5]|uniref:Helicase associated domain protein n=1 Tax=Arthrobacter sp. KK5.5 TaxID=3373084 RepID=UPI003EE763D7